MRDSDNRRPDQEEGLEQKREGASSENNADLGKKRPTDASEGPGQFEKDKRRRSRTVSVEQVSRAPKFRTEGSEWRPRHEESAERREQAEREFKPRENHNPYSERAPRDYQPRPERREQSGGPERFEHPERRDKPERRSYNPNFSADNKFIGGPRTERPERDFNRREPYPERDFNRRDPKRGGNFGPGSDRPAQKFGPKRDNPGQKKTFVKRNTGAMNAGVKPEKYPSYDAFSDKTAEMRLNRYIAMAGKCSRRQADEYIANGDVTVNGKTTNVLGTKILPTDEVKLRGELLSSEKKVYIVMNKPKGFVTSVDDPHAEKTVMDIVRNACSERIYPVGRLDKSSVGVLLLTNDGDLTEKLTHPANNKKKVYQITLERPLTTADLMRARDGIDLDDGVIIPDAVDFVKPDNRKEVGIEIHSGRNRIVRRIFEEMGYGVHKLDRVYFAGLTKKNLKRGQWRFLTDKEVAMLKSGRYE